MHRLAVVGAAADAAYEQIVGVRFAGRTEREIGADLAGFLRGTSSTAPGTASG